jgi:hypothetical protein
MLRLAHLPQRRHDALQAMTNARQGCQAPAGKTCSGVAKVHGKDLLWHEVDGQKLVAHVWALLRHLKKQQQQQQNITAVVVVSGTSHAGRLPEKQTKP